MSFMQKLFGSTPAQNQPPSAQQNQNPNVGLPGTQASLQTAPNGVVPTEPAQPEKKENVSPLDGFKDIWQNTNTLENPEAAGMFANLDPAKLMESARKVNFSGAITQESLAAIQAGGPEAVKAFSESLNSVAQTVYAQSAIATTKIVEQALGKQQEKYDASLPNLVKNLSTKEALLTNNPLMSNPAIQPLVGALQESLVRKNPTATSAEIQQQVVDYFSALGNTFATKPAPTKAEKTAAKTEDWDKFLQM